MIIQEQVRIVVLYSNITGFVIGWLKALLKAHPSINIDVVHHDKQHINSGKYKIESGLPIRFHARSTLDDSGLLNLLTSCNPNIIYVSGWMDKGYLCSIRKYRANGGSGQVVCGTDGQWFGTLRQHLGRIYFKLFYRQLFDFMWVAGKPQYHYAQRFGYTNETIITNLLSADSEVFSKKAKVSKRFVFIGRFDPIKALDQLIEAYLLLPPETQRQWPLVLIGDGELMEFIKSKQSANIIVKPFLQPEALKEEMDLGGVACITSHKEAWGVAIHEMAIYGFPLILSSSCGASTEFLISGYNGFLFRHGNVSSLKEALLRITAISDADLELFSQRSHDLGQRIKSEYSAYSFLSVLSLAKL